MPINVFLCYAHEDEALLKQLKKHLKPLERDGLIELWDDREIGAGQEWKREIHQRLNAAQIILLLVSPDFINSTYCYDTELQQALERYRKGEEVRIIPVIGHAVDWQSTLGHLQALPKDALPITDPGWHHPNRAFYNVAESLRKIVTNFPPSQPSSSEKSLQQQNKELSLYLQKKPPLQFLQAGLPDYRRWSRRVVLPTIVSAVILTGSLGISWLTLTKRDTSSSPPHPRSGTTLLTYRGHTDSIWSVTWSPDSKRLASAGGHVDRTVQIWDASKGTPPLFIKKGHSDNVFAVAWSPNGKYLISGSGTLDKTIRLWDADQEGSALNIYRGHADTIWSVTWSPDSRYFASASNDTTVRVWDAGKAGDPLFTYNGHSDAVWSVAWSPERKYLASASKDGAVHIWNTSKAGDPLFIYRSHSASVNSVAWSPDGKHLVFAGNDATIWVWEVSKIHNPLIIYKGSSEKIHAVAWSPDGKYLASASNEIVRIWDASKSNMVGIYEDHFATVRSVVWSSDGRQLASSGDDKTVRVWKW